MNREIPARFQSTFGEPSGAKASRIDNVLQKRVRNPIEMPEITPSSAGLLTRIVDKAAGVLPSKKAVALLSSASILVVACGDSATEITPPTTTPIVTTVPETIIPITTLPPTTTTETPTATSTTTTTSTTIPETTTTSTTEAPPTTLPANISNPTGEVLDRETSDPIPLGINQLLENQYYKGAILNARLIDYYTETQDDFQGKPAEVAYIEIVVGKYNNGDPIILKGKIGRPELDSIVIVNNFDARGIKVNGNSIPISILFEEGSILENRQYSQIRFAFAYEDTNNYEKNICENNTLASRETLCEKVLDSLETRHYGKKIITLLQRGNIDPSELSDQEKMLSTVYEIHIFPTL